MTSWLEKTRDYASIYSAINSTRDEIDKIKGSINKKIQALAGGKEGICAVVVGSYGRLEASDDSDFDFFVLYEKDDKVSKKRAKKVAKIIEDEIKSRGIKLPTSGGTFNAVHSAPHMLTQIGGDDDDNKSITRRMLFLLESRVILNEERVNTIREAMVDRYISNSISDHQIGLFFLNDVIRYYRTVCVDFDYKTAVLKKDWGLRNIKLVFSRKLLYFSGVIIAAEAAQMTATEKKKTLKKLCAMTPIERMIEVCGDRAADVLHRYDYFVKCISNTKIRSHVKEVTSEKRRDSEIFRSLKNHGHHFSWALLQLLRSQYELSHPIHRALVL